MYKRQACEDVNTIGGFANWVQDAEYTTCPHCGKPMKYLVKIQWDTLFDCAEGTLYVEFCPEMCIRDRHRPNQVGTGKRDLPAGADGALPEADPE